MKSMRFLMFVFCLLGVLSTKRSLAQNNLPPDFFKAINLLNQGKFAEALPYFQSFSSSYETQAEVWWWLGNAYYLNGDIVQTEQAYIEALARRPDYLEAFLNLIQLYEQQNRQAEAEALKQKMDKNIDQVLRDYFLLVKKKTQLKSYDDALNTLNKIINDNPNNFQAYKERAIIAMRLKKGDIVQQDLVKAMAMNPVDMDVLVMAAKTEAQQKKYAEALAYLNKALALDDRAAYLYFQRGNILAKKRDYKGAAADFNQALRLQDNEGVYLYNQALMSMVQGKFKKAKAELQFLDKQFPIDK